MSDKPPFNFTEIDVDYVSLRSENLDPKRRPRRIEKKREWVMSLFLPCLSIIASAVFFPTSAALFIVPLGLIAGGVVPLVIIIRNRLDTSRFFRGKMILFALTVAQVVLSWTLWTEWLSEKFYFLIPSAVMIILEAVYAATRKADALTKLTLWLSSLSLGYFGFVSSFPFFF